ncbi:MAG: amylo-alpha-1,6-glucosidase [Bacteroidota bacterium]
MTAVQARQAGGAVLALCFFLFLLTGCREVASPADALLESGPALLADLAVEVPALDDFSADSLAIRSTVQSDTRGGFLYDALNGPQTDAAMGWTVGGFRVLDGWRWAADTIALGPDRRQGGAARPDVAVRTYEAALPDDLLSRAGRVFSRETPLTLAERITLLDATPDAPGAVLIEVADSLGTLTLRPTVSDRGPNGYNVVEEGRALLVARSNYLTRRGTRPVWLAVQADGGAVSTRIAETDPEAGRSRGVTVGAVTFGTPGRVVMAVGATPEEAAARAASALREGAARTARRAERMAALLDRTYVRPSDDRQRRALAWAHLMADALVVRDGTTTTVAEGLPGTLRFPGRSTLRTLAPLFLAPGDFETARAVLTTFGRAQVFDQNLKALGRAPNAFVNGRPQFDTPDATPVFGAAIADYVRATGETSLISGAPDYWFKTVFATRGLYGENTRRTALVDSLGLLRAGTGGTWMGELDRTGAPVEAQGALVRHLRAMGRFARIMRVTQRAQDFEARAEALEQRVQQTYFPEGGAPRDRLDRDGQPDRALRPNALIALADLDLDPLLERQAARRLAEALAYEHGVGTQAQTDSTTFYPYLRAPEFFEPPRAAFRGPVWTALTAPLVHLMVEQGGAESAQTLTDAQTNLLLDGGAVGGLPAVVDAHPHLGEDVPRTGGSPVDLYALAGFVGNAWQDYLGVRFETASQLVLEPRIPAEWGTTQTRLRLGDGFVRATLALSETALSVSVVPEEGLAPAAELRLRAFGSEVAVPLVTMQDDTLAIPRDSLIVEVTPTSATVNGQGVEATATYAMPASGFWDDFAFVVPRVREQYEVMRRVQRRSSLTLAQVKRPLPVARSILSRTDPEGDDWGSTTSFTYPAGLPDGVLDARFLELTADDSTTYFRIDLARPAPEGRPLPLFVALAIDREDGGERDIGQGADLRLPGGTGYEHIVYVGNGVRVETGRGRVLGRLEGGGALIDPGTTRLTFALPHYILPRPQRGDEVTLLLGAYAPGAGVGRFATVGRTATETQGGGKPRADGPNVYDLITARVTR